MFRLRTTNLEVVLPNYLAIGLTGSWNMRLMAGSTILRAPVRELEIPLLPIGEQDALVQAIVSVQHIQEQANRLDLGTGQMREARRDSIRFGITLSPDSAEPVDNSGTGGVK